jgi:hypothetical protein
MTAEPPAIRVTGIDTGPVSGIFEALWLPGARVPAWSRAYQCDDASAPGLLAFILGLPDRVGGPVLRLGGIEQIRDSTVRGAGLATARQLVVTLSALAGEHGVTVFARPAATVKTWATGRRLEKAGLTGTLGKMKDDAYCAAQQCLYTACHDGGLPDPLSRRAASC